MTIDDLAAEVAAHDGVAALGEASLLSIRADDVPRVERLVEDGGAPVGFAYAARDEPVELLVHPAHRRRGIGRGLIDELLAAGEDRFWAHGDLPAAQALAAAAGLVPVRTLLVLRLRLFDAPAAERVPEGVTIRTFTEADAEAVVAVNGRAFAHHPEQGAMDLADFRRRASTDWFDPAGLFVAEREGTVVGFHWTKIEGGIGEVYVVGVDPSEHGRGLGTALTARGIRHLWDSGIDTVDLYVEGDNAPALAVYTGLGFTEHARDVLYSPTPSGR